MIQIEKTKMTGKALLKMKDGRLIAYKKGYLVIYENELETKHILLPIPLWKRIACKIRLLERLLHTDIRWAIDINDQDEILFLYANNIYKANLKTGDMVIDFCGFKGQPFSVTRTNNRVLFGDYGKNNIREPVKIYERKCGKWKTVYTFPAKTVRHIHNIIPAGDCFYILTGDEDQESGVWKADKDFNVVEALMKGKQKYRCCQMLIQTDHSGYYLTDAPSESNYCYSFDNNIIKVMDGIPGTCIYGVSAFGGLLFSTTVEADAHAKNAFEYWLTNKPGIGIQDNKTYVMLLKDERIIKIACFEHDKKPLRLFQYATVYFAFGNDDMIYYCTPYSVKKYDNIIHKIEYFE